MIAPGSLDVREAVADIKVFNCVHGHDNGFLLRETAKSLGVELLGDLSTSTGCSIDKGHRKPTANKLMGYAEPKKSVCRSQWAYDRPFTVR